MLKSPAFCCLPDLESKSQSLHVRNGVALNQRPIAQAGIVLASAHLAGVTFLYSTASSASP